MKKLIHENPETGDLTCNVRDFDQIFPTLHAYEELEMTPEDIEQTLLRFSSFLVEMTGGRMSKTNYTVQAMVSEANDYQQRICDECSDRQELAEIEKELEKLKKEREVLRVENLNMASLVEQLMEIKKERDAMAAALKNRGCCDTCRHCDIERDQHPCDSCRQDPNYPSWEWKGE